MRAAPRQCALALALALVVLAAPCCAQAPLFTVTAAIGARTKTFGPYYARTSTFGALVTVASAPAWSDLTFVVIDASGCELNETLAAPDARSALLIPSMQPADWARTCTEIQMCVAAFRLGYRALLIADTSGVLGPMNITSDGPLHGMRGIAPELADFVALFVSQPTGAYLADMYANVDATNITFLVTTDDRTQQAAWMRFYVGWVTAACVVHGLLVLVVIACAVYLIAVLGVSPLHNSFLALCAAGAAALLVVVYAGAAFLQARPFLATPGYAVLADLNEALEVVALVLYAHSWAAAAAPLVGLGMGAEARPARVLASPRLAWVARLVALAYLLVFLALSIARGYAQPVWNAPILLNVAALTLLVALFIVLGVLLVRGAVHHGGGVAKNARLASIVQRTIAFLVINTLAVAGKLVLNIVALALDRLVQEQFYPVVLAFDTLIVASIIAIVVAVIPALRDARTASTLMSGGAAADGPAVFSARDVRRARRGAAPAPASAASSDSESFERLPE